MRRRQVPNVSIVQGYWNCPTCHVLLSSHRTCHGYEVIKIRHHYVLTIGRRT